MSWGLREFKFGYSVSRVGSVVLTAALLSSRAAGSSPTSSPNMRTRGSGYASRSGAKGSMASFSAVPSSSFAAVGKENNKGSNATTARPMDKAESLASGIVADMSKPSVIFVLGGPGSGKGTQSKRLADELGYVHLSAGELLRKERTSGSSDGQLIDQYIREGRIVPVAISLGLLRRAMAESGPFSRFLIDGFPRNSDNVKGWESIMGNLAKVRCVLFLYCPEEVLEQRLLARGKSSGRTDDNAETARRRFRTYIETTLPVVEDFERRGIVARVDGDQDMDSVFRDVRAGLKATLEEEVLEANRAIVDAACRGDWETYSQLCTTDMTEITCDGQALSAPVTDPSTGAAPSLASISRPQVRMLSGAAGVVSYERWSIPASKNQPAGLLEGAVGQERIGDTGKGASVFQDTRVWEVREGIWKCVHCHTSSLGSPAAPQSPPPSW